MAELQTHSKKINKPWNCWRCDSKFNNVLELRKHFENKHNIGISKTDDDTDVTWFYCDQDGCDYKSKHKCRLKEHKAFKHNIGVTWYHCDHDGCNYKCIYGGGGGRLDHLMGIMTLFEREDHPNLWIADSTMVRAIDDTVVMEHCIGETVSFFPLGDRITTMSSKGLRWPLDGLKWKKGDCGISNLVSGERMQVTVKSGRLIMMSSVRKLGRLV